MADAADVGFVAPDGRVLSAAQAYAEADAAAAAVAGLNPDRVLDMCLLGAQEGAGAAARDNNDEEDDEESQEEAEDDDALMEASDEEPAEDVVEPPGAAAVDGFGRPLQYRAVVALANSNRLQAGLVLSVSCASGAAVAKVALLSGLPGVRGARLHNLRTKQVRCSELLLLQTLVAGDVSIVLRG